MYLVVQSSTRAIYFPKRTPMNWRLRALSAPIFGHGIVRATASGLRWSWSGTSSASPRRRRPRPALVSAYPAPSFSLGAECALSDMIASKSNSKGFGFACFGEPPPPHTQQASTTDVLPNNWRCLGFTCFCSWKATVIQVTLDG